MKPDERPQPPAHSVKYFYFLDSQKIDSTSFSITGAAVRANLPSEKSGYAIFLESQGADPDKQVQDSDVFSLDKPPLKFYSAPPATFG
jgi:hypothetical protein